MTIWPQITAIAMFAAGFGINLIKNGEPKGVNYSIGIYLISTSIEVSILYFGGFFTSIGWAP